MPRAVRLLQESAATLETARRAVRGQLGVLRIGFGLATIQRLLPDLLLRFRAALPGVELRLRDMATTAQVVALARGDLDVGFVRLPVNDPHIETQPILRERLVALLGTQNRWSSRRGLRSAAQQPFDHHRAQHRGRLLRSRHRRLPRRRLHAEHRPGNQRAVHDDDARPGRHGHRACAKLGDDPPSTWRPRQGDQEAEAAWDIGIAWSQAHPDAPLVRAFVETALRGRRLPALSG